MFISKRLAFLSLSTIMDVYFYRLGIFFQSIFDVNSQVTWNTNYVGHETGNMYTLQKLVNLVLLIQMHPKEKRGAAIVYGNIHKRYHHCASTLEKQLLSSKKGKGAG